MAPCLRDAEPIRSRYRSDDNPLDTFLLPVLEHAHQYDRSAGYFSSTSLAAAATGLEPFIERGGQIRLIVNHQIADRDVDAITQGLDLKEALGSSLSTVPLNVPLDDTDATVRFRLLATLVALGQLELKVAVPTDTNGTPLHPDETMRIHHAKFGIFTDTCEPAHCIAFEGSNNESRSGWLENYETYTTFRSWKPELWAEYGDGIADDFHRHWTGEPPTGWAIFDLPTAAERKLIAASDPELVRHALSQQGRTDEIEDVINRIMAARGHATTDDVFADIRELLTTPTRLPGTGIATAGITPWIHQSDIARKYTTAAPASRLLADEVGLGKTIEVGLILRELIASRRANRILLLVPAAVIWQWQSELWEKFSLAIPVLSGTKLVGPEHAPSHGQRLETPIDGNRWDATDIMLASSHLARRASERNHLATRHWDLVVVDEAHHARRRGSNPTKNEPNALLRLLRDMKRHRSWDGVILATATPMQMHPHEAFDLLELLDLPSAPDGYETDPAWATTSARGFVSYYEALAQPDPTERDWRHLRNLARSQFAAHPEPNPHLDATLKRQVADGAITATSARRIQQFHTSIATTSYQSTNQPELGWLDVWLREHTPMRTSVHRHTRHLLRAYQTNGIIPDTVTIPARNVRDLRVDFDDTEQELYNRIETWIRTQYTAVADAAAAGDTKAKALGFVMTVYRRRLTSSFHAMELSLRRRRDALHHRSSELIDLLDSDDVATADIIDDDLDRLFDPDTVTDWRSDLITASQEEIAELDAFLADLANRPNYDSKLGALIDDLRIQLGTTKPDGTPRQALIFTQFTDTMDSLREELAQIWPSQVACYSGRGGEHHTDPNTWTPMTKAAVKAAFTNGKFRILLGTDAMSEGLNLQTAELLYNLDLPWNFSRIEQRVGRIDRIGGHPTVNIVNVLINGTVEERIYTGIRDDFGSFESIVGAAQPVLAQTEAFIRTAAFDIAPNRTELIEQQAKALVAAAQAAEASPVNLDTFQHEPDKGTWTPARPLPGEITNGLPWNQQLREALTTHPVFGQRFTPVDDDVWTFTADDGTDWRVTFDAAIADKSAGEIGLLTWGHPAFPTLPPKPRMSNGDDG